MASKVEICNIALHRIGQRPIQSIDENSNEAYTCRTFYDLARTAALRVHPWNFALKSQLLALLEDAEDDWTYAYQLPSDCLRAVKIVLAAGTDPAAFEVRGQMFLTDQENVKLQYVYNLEDPSLFSAEFVEALTYRMASDMAVPITGRADYMQSMMQGFMTSMAKAGASDGNERRQKQETTLKSRRQ